MNTPKCDDEFIVIYDRGSKKYDYGFKQKHKGGLKSLLTDFVYIQNSKANYIDFLKIWRLYRKELLDRGLNKYTDSGYYRMMDRFLRREQSYAFGIDILGSQLKDNKVFYGDINYE